MNESERAIQDSELGSANDDPGAIADLVEFEGLAGRTFPPAERTAFVAAALREARRASISASDRERRLQAEFLGLTSDCTECGEHQQSRRPGFISHVVGGLCVECREMADGTVVVRQVRDAADEAAVALAHPSAMARHDDAPPLGD